MFGCKSHHGGLQDGRWFHVGSKMSLCTGHSSCAVTLPVNLSTTAFLHRSRVQCWRERSVPEIKCMAEFSWTLMRSAWVEHDQPSEAAADHPPAWSVGSCWHYELLFIVCYTNACQSLQGPTFCGWISLSLIEIIWAMMIVWRIKGKLYLNCSVLCCVRQFCTAIRTHARAVVKDECWFRFRFSFCAFV